MTSAAPLPTTPRSRGGKSGALPSTFDPRAGAIAAGWLLARSVMRRAGRAPHAGHRKAKHTMNLSDLALEPQQVAEAAGPTAGAGAEPLDTQALIAQLGSEVASTLSSALERVAGLAATGRIGRDSLRALREEIERARRAGIMGQQVVRLGSGHVHLARERLDLNALFREALRQRRGEMAARGIEVRQLFTPASVASDATLLFSMLQTTLDWSFEHAVSRIDLTLEVKNWPAHAQLFVAFAHRPPDEVEPDGAVALAAEDSTLNTVSWRLLQRTAGVLGLFLRRRDLSGKTELALEFPDTVAPTLLAAGDAESEPLAVNSQPLAGRHLLVLAARREVRNVVREALRPMGLMIDFVASVEQAQELRAGGLPHAVVYEAALGGERFERLRGEWLAEAPGLAFVQIAEEGRAFEVLNAGEHQFASVGRDAIIESLPAALLFELAREG